MGSLGPYLMSPCISIIRWGLQKRFDELFLASFIITVCVSFRKTIIQPALRTVKTKSVKKVSAIKRLQRIPGIIYVAENDFQPRAGNGTSQMYEQWTARHEKFLTKAWQPVTDRPHLSFHVEMVCHEPVMPADHGCFRRINFRIFIIQSYDIIYNTGNSLLRIMLVGNQKIREHPVKFSAFGICAPVSGNADPFTGSVFIADDAFAVIPKDQWTVSADRT